MFKEVLSSKKEIDSRKLIYEVAVNDSVYRVRYNLNSKTFHCPYYMAWHGMLARCCSDSFQKHNKTYIGCTVDSEWLTFSVFKKWMKGQDWVGKQLDKDLLFPKNKHYSSDRCIFVDQKINLLLNYHLNRSGAHPIGVFIDRGKFRTQCCVNGRRTNVGMFDAAIKASRAYKEFKSNHIREVAKEYVNDYRLYRALLTHSNIILNGEVA